MTPNRGAQVIPFPCRDDPPAGVENMAAGIRPDAAGEHLRRALAALDAAVERQREAVQQWRSALGSLRGNVQDLHASLQEYGATLGSLRGQVDAVGATARGLEAWADAAAHAGQAPP
jgi:hypothetical protein